jgi:hypothetical protein
MNECYKIDTVDPEFVFIFSLLLLPAEMPLSVPAIGNLADEGLG